MNTDHCSIIANPAAGGGRTGRMLGVLKGLLHTSFGSETSVSVTGKAGDAWESARQAVLDGSRRIVIIGGDGTIHECVNGIYSLPPVFTQSVTLAIISTGTGCGLARSLGIPSAIEDQIVVARESHTRALDLGRLNFINKPRVRFFVNECQVGIGAEVVRRTRMGKKALGGSLAYTLATLPLLFTYPNPVVELMLEDSAPFSLPVTGISIGNGAITGGGMHLTPHALLDDGLIDVLVMKGQSPLRRAASFARVRSGSHVQSSRFAYHQVRSIRISSQSELLLAADGEMLGSLPATIEVYPNAIHVHCPVPHRRENLHEHTSGKTEEIGI
jgi:YegS/Rv2252/BmrU family lipid kinase